jgi:hypothetical protein
MFSACKKDEPMPCKDTCRATLFDSGIKEQLVGKWRFYKVKWYKETLGGASLISYKDTIELGSTYELDIHANGTIDYYRNDSFVETKKLEVYIDNTWDDGPNGWIGFIESHMNCVNENPIVNDFSCVLRYPDTITVKYHPIYYNNEAAGESSGKGFYYRIQ